MPTSTPLSTEQLREALQISVQIDALQQKLKALLGGTVTIASVAPVAPAATGKTRRVMSPATRAKMRAAQQARRAKMIVAAAPTPAPAKTTKKRGLTPEGRAKLAAAMKARWAARKAGGPAPNAGGR